MAITQERKQELVAHYADWVKRSQALIITTYVGLNQKDLDTVRGKIRELGGEFHIIKNTLAVKTLEQAGMPVTEDCFEGSTAVAFAFQDAPAVAKAVTEFAKGNEFVKIKGGYLDKAPITASGVKALADLPPLPVVRAHLLGVILAPASKLVRTLAEPARSLAAVLQARNEAAGATEPVTA